MIMSTNPCASNVNTSSPSDMLHDVEVIGYRYVISSVCIFGVVCNLLNLCVLLQRRLKESPYTYLTGLAIADMITLISMSPVSIVRGDFIRDENIFYALTRLQTRICMPLANYFGQVSIMITVALTVERYLFTTYPLRTRSFCKPRYARVVIAIISIFCGIVNFPRFLSETVETNIDSPALFNSSPCSTYPFVIAQSSVNSSHVGQCFCMIGKTAEWFLPVKDYYYYTLLIMNQILPFVVLLFLNWSLIRRVQTSNRFTLQELVARQHYSINSPTPIVHTIKQKRLRDEHRLTKTLVSIVIIFLICNTFTIVSYPGFVRFITERRYPTYIHVGFRIQRLITNIMLLLNYSINFFFYCAFNKKFLETLKMTFGSKGLCARSIQAQQRALATNSTRSLHSTLGAQMSKPTEPDRLSLEQIRCSNMQRGQFWNEQRSRRKSEENLMTVPQHL